MSESAVIIVRSAIFIALFYLNISLRMILALPTLAMPRSAMHRVLLSYASSSLWLARVICGIKVEWRGRDRLPEGPCIVACKHQSAWETFALFLLLDDPTYVLKRELMELPLFGWLATKSGMIPVDRSGGAKALAQITRATRDQLAEGRQVVIFPEGTRRSPDAEPRYQPGVALLYAESRVPCVPIALNSGLFWPRHTFRRYPGTIIVEVLDPIPPGLDRRSFVVRLQSELETATTRLVAEGRGA